MSVLAIINARGGSKGVPRKNIKPLMGKPLIAWSIEAGSRSELIDKLIVSTDDIEIANVAAEHGASVPFIRPAELATDKALQIDAIRHAVGFLEDAGECFDVILILQPTVPLREAQDIDRALTLLQKSGADSVISVCDVGGRHPVTCYHEQDGFITPILQCDDRGVLRQEFGQVLWRNGAIYAMRRDTVMVENSLYGKSTVGYVMPESRSFNIDSTFDWDVTEGYLRLIKDRGNAG